MSRRQSKEEREIARVPMQLDQGRIDISLRPSEIVLTEYGPRGGERASLWLEHPPTLVALLGLIDSESTGLLIEELPEGSRRSHLVARCDHSYGEMEVHYSDPDHRVGGRFEWGASHLGPFFQMPKSAAADLAAVVDWLSSGVNSRPVARARWRPRKVLTEGKHGFRPERVWSTDDETLAVFVDGTTFRGELWVQSMVAARRVGKEPWRRCTPRFEEMDPGLIADFAIWEAGRI
jgi:hypothetical protein